MSPIAGVTPPKPGSATKPFFGIEPLLVDSEGRVIDGEGEGNLCMARPWPGQARTIHGDHARFRETYFSRFAGLYFTGDGCKRDGDGDLTITGRVDDVLNVSGHRLGTAEIESAMVAHEAVSEAAVVGLPHAIKGTGVHAFVVLRDGADIASSELPAALREKVRSAIGPIATPEAVRIVPGLPKTRSGKIMRRVLRDIASGKTSGFGDLSTLANPEIIDVVVQALASPPPPPPSFSGRTSGVRA